MFRYPVSGLKTKVATAVAVVSVMMCIASSRACAQNELVVDGSARGSIPIIRLRTNVSVGGKAGITEHWIFGPYNDVYGDPGALFIGAGQSPTGGKNNMILYNLSCTGGCNVPSISLLADKTYMGGNLQVVGDVQVSGNIAAKYQDLAEWVAAAKPLPSGTVVVLDKTHANRVTASRRRYDTGVAGVVSETPGLLLGEGGADKLKIATTGRVKIRVDARNGAIAIGDLLVTSGVEGVAMKSQPIKVAGIPIHRPGTLIGKALEPLSSGQSEITVLLSLQ